jgi:magnesium transporter
MDKITQHAGVILYNKTQLLNLSYDDYLKWLKKPSFKADVVWINIDDKTTFKQAKPLIDTYEFHPILLEYTQEENRRASLQLIDDELFIVAKMMYYKLEELIFEQISFIYHPGLIVTIGEYEGDVFDSIRDRLQNPLDPMRTSQTDYLLYILLDRLVDAYFDVITELEDDVEDLEERVLHVHAQKNLHEIRVLKRDLLYMHKHIWPLRDVLSRLSHGEQKITPETQIYLRDVQDHLYQVLDSVDTMREVLSSLVDIYLSNASIKMNEIMKVLTIISTIFIPLTFIVGLYGMNFKYMPEINWIYGYPMVLILMLSVAVGLIIYFKRKKWF